MKRVLCGSALLPLSLSVIAIAVLLFSPLVAPTAKADNLYARIQGTVADPSGAALVGVKLTATNVGTSVSYESESKAEGNFAFIKGDKGDPNATFLFQGQMEVLKENIDAGKIKNVCETFTDGWKPDNAQKNMEQCLTSTGNKVDAVVSENDGMASGVVAALDAQGLAGSVPVSGQDGDKAALNRVALGTQTVSVWKDSRALGKAAGEAAVAIADGKDAASLPGVTKFNKGKNGVEVNAILLTPDAITKDNLNDVIDAGWISKAEACAGVKAGTVKACD